MEGQPVKGPKHRFFRRLRLSPIGQAVSIMFTLYWVFIVQGPVVFHPLFLIALPLIWIALDHGFKPTTAAIFLSNSGVILALVFFRLDLARLVELQLMMIINCVICLLMGVVTERKLAVQGFYQSDQMIRQSRDIILLVESETGRILEANEAAIKEYGYTREEILALTIYNLRSPDTSALLPGQFDQAKRDGILFETIHQRKDGSKFPVEVNSKSIIIDGVNKR